MEKVDNLEYVMGLVYTILKAMEFGVGINEVEILIRLVEERHEAREDAFCSPVIDPYGASSNGTTKIHEVGERIASVMRDLNIPIPKEESFEMDRLS